MRQMHPQDREVKVIESSHVGGSISNMVDNIFSSESTPENSGEETLEEPTLNPEATPFEPQGLKERRDS